MNYVLIVSHPEDKHAHYIARYLINNNMAIPVLFDLHDFPLDNKIVFKNSEMFFQLHGKKICEREIKSIWWRKSQEFSYGDIQMSREMENFCTQNNYEAIEGFVEVFGDRVIDPLFQTDRADRKIFQLNLAKKIGFKIPQTCVTNDPIEAKKFINSVDRVIYKTFRATNAFGPPTTLLEKEDIDKINTVSQSVVIFQEYVSLGFDIRVTVVGRNIFAAKITTMKEHARNDIRLDFGAKIESYHLPDEIEDKIYELMSRLGLRYATIDMRVNNNNEYFFLEINPRGQYLYVEIKTMQPITKTLANLLSNPFSQSNSQSD